MRAGGSFGQFHSGRLYWDAGAPGRGVNIPRANVPIKGTELRTKTLVIEGFQESHDIPLDVPGVKQGKAIAPLKIEDDHALGMAQELVLNASKPNLPPGTVSYKGRELMDMVLGVPFSRKLSFDDGKVVVSGAEVALRGAPRLDSYDPSQGSPSVRDIPAADGPVLDWVGRGGGLLERLARWMGKPFRVFPDPDRNKQFWYYVLGQAMVSIGVSFHYSALPKLVAPNKEDTKELGINRAVNWTSQAAASLATGPYVNRSSNRNVLVWSYLGRTLLLLAVPVLFFHGAFATPVFLAIIFATGFLQSMGMTAGSVAFNRILGENQEQFNKANAVYSLVIYTVSFIAPLAAGAFIGIMDVRYGLLAGNALSYGVYAALLFFAALLYKNFLRSPVPVASLMGESAQPKSQRGLLKEISEGFRLIWRDRFLKLSLAFSTLYVFAGDAIVFTALPRYIQDVLGASTALPPGLGGIPVLGTFLTGLTSSAGAFGLYLAASALGLGLATAWMMRKSRSSVSAGKDELDSSAALSPLERQARWSSILAGLGMLTYWGVFFIPNLWLSVSFMILGAMLQGPAGVIWSSLNQRVLLENHPKNMGKVYSAIFFYQLLVSIAGILFFGWLMGAVSTVAALWIVCGALSIVAVLNFIEPFILFPLRGRPK